jgi:hypothetical protein
MKRQLLLSVLVLFALALMTQAQSDLPALEDLDEGWNAIATDGVCSAGTPYQFYARSSPTSDNLLIFFNGGGACWFGQACDIERSPNIHVPFADEESNNPNLGDGIFALDNAQNPFADYDMVFLPYCTGDVFIGGGETVYTYMAGDEEVSVTTFHNGFENSMTVLDWTTEAFATPARVFVAGSSAGAIGSSFYAGFVAEHYGDVPVVLLADAAGGYNSPDLADTFRAWDTASILPDWDVYAGETNDTLTFEDFYIASANHNDNLTIAQYNTAYDETQVAFTTVLGDPVDSFTLPQRILHHYIEIESAVDTFYAYTAGGDVHTILRSPVFYTYSVEGVDFRDWVADLAQGNPVDDVSCVDDVLGCAPAPDDSDE